jgi:phytoene synthase
MDQQQPESDDSPVPRKLPLSLARPSGGRRSNLALALIFLPRARRRDAFLFYDFCRTVDNLADDRTLGTHEKQECLDAWLHALKPGHEENLPTDFRTMILRRQLDRHLLLEIVRGMRMDTEQNRYATFEALQLYCWRVASAVGLLTSTIFGAYGTALLCYARELGVALQLTNILRDVAEDASMNRLYLPLEDLTRFGITEQEIFSKNPSPAMTHLLHFQAERADAFFAKAEGAWSAMSRNQQRLMRPARLMSAIYRDLLLQMHRDRYDVFQHHYRVSKFKKILLAIRLLTGR